MFRVEVKLTVPSSYYAKKTPKFHLFKTPSSNEARRKKYLK